MAGKAQSREDQQIGVQVVNSKSYLYSQVIPKHLRNHAACPPPPTSGSETAVTATATAATRRNHTGEATATRRNPTGSSTAAYPTRPATVNFTKISTAHLTPTLKADPRHSHSDGDRRTGPSSHRRKNRLRSLMQNWRTVTSSLQDVRTPCRGDGGEVGQAADDRLRKSRARSLCEPGFGSALNCEQTPRPESSGTARHGHTAERGMEFDVEPSREVPRRAAVDRDGDNDSDKDDGYCGLRRVTVTGEVKQSWRSRRQVSREEWCPFSLRRTDPPRGVNINVSQAHGEHHSHAPSSDDVVLRHPEAQPHHHLAPTRSDDACDLEDTSPKPHQIPSTLPKAGEKTQQAGMRRKSLTLEEGCNLVFPHTARHTTTYTRREEDEEKTDRHDDGGVEGIALSSRMTGGGAEKDHNEHGRMTDDDAVEDPVQHNRTGDADSDRIRHTTDEMLTLTLTREPRSQEQQEPFVGEDAESVPSSLQHSRRGSDASLNAPQQAAQDQVDESQSVNVLKTCSVCLLPSSDITLMQCFHLVCTACMIPTGEETVKCGVCKAEQAAPQDGIVFMKDIFPGLFAARGTPSVSPSAETGSARILDVCQDSTVIIQQQCVPNESVPGCILKGSDNTPTGFGRILAGFDSTPEGSKASFQSSDISKVSQILTAHESQCSAGQSGDEGSEAKGMRPMFKEQAAISSLHDQLFPWRNYLQDKAKNRSGTSEAVEKEQSIKATDNSVNNQNDYSDDDDSSIATVSSPSSGSYSLDHTTTTTTTTVEDGSISRDNNHLTTKGQTCGACLEEAETQHACVTCGGIPLCSGCRTAHFNLPITRCHEVVALVSSSSSSSSPLSPLTLLSHHQPACPHHGQDLSLQCCTCGVFLCHRCLAPQHTRHEVRELGNVYHANRKLFSGLQRSFKQHVLAARSAGREVREQLRRVGKTRRKVRHAIQAVAQRHVTHLTSQAERMSSEVDRVSQARHFLLSKTHSDVTRVQSEGGALRNLMNVVSEDTPPLTRLIIQSACQVRFDKLRQQTSLNMEEFEDMVFCPDALLSDQLTSQCPLGTVRSLASSVLDTSLHILAIFRIGGEVNAIASTPYDELVCVSSTSCLCQVWDPREGALLVDVSRHVTRPSDVQVTPSGVLVVLGAEGAEAVYCKGSKACLTFLSPAGSLLARLPLSSEVQLTHVHCLSNSRVLVSDERAKTLNLYDVDSLTHPEPRDNNGGSREVNTQRPTHQQLPSTSTASCSSSSLAPLRQFSHPALRHPRHVTATPTGDWLVNDLGCFMRLVSPEGHVSTILTEDEPEAALQPPRSSRHDGFYSSGRCLTSVCCDSEGRMMAANCGKNGLYIVTSPTSASGHGERHFVSLHELTSSCHVTCMAVNRKDHVIVGMSDGNVYVMKMGAKEGDKS